MDVNDARVGLTTALWLVLGATGACHDDAPAVGGESGSEGSGPTGSTTAQPGADSTGSMTSGADETTTGEPPPPAACGQGHPIPATEQAPGDPNAGYHALLNEGYVTCGIPYPLFNLAQGLLGGFADGEPLPERVGKNAEVPHSWTVHTGPSGAEIVSLNCLECHAGSFNGELILGLGKADVDYTSSLGGALANIPIAPIPIPGLEELTRMAQRYQAVDDHIRMLTVGTNPADNLAAILATHRDVDTLEWLDEPHTELPAIPLPIDTPPWWHVRKKNGLFFNGMARGDHRATMIFATSLCTDSLPEVEQIFSYFDDIRAYLASLEAPTYPFEIDSALAAQGRDIFDRDCACCHGTYADDEADETYPNLLFPLDVVGTDPLLATSIDEQPMVQWFNESWYGEVGQLTPSDPFRGYVAPPLDGIWASAPYFHNASVPTLALVLDSSARPEHWRRVDYDSTHFDQFAVGWPWVPLPYGQDDAPEQERKHVYDTTRLGHWNTGHTFGDHLDDAERRAVLEYLKTL